MAITFIDNQPIRFNSAKFDDQSCINKDISGYAILMQPGDPLNFQAKQYCCEGNIACDADELGVELVTDGDMSNPASWTASGGWVVAAGVATLTAVGSDGQLTQTLGGATAVGHSYRIQINVISNSTGYAIDVYLGGRRAYQIAPNSTGVQTFYGVSGQSSSIAIKTTNDYSVASTGVLVVDDVSVKEIASCYTFDTSTTEYAANGAFSGSANGWSLEAGWAYAANAINHTTAAADDAYQQLYGILHRHDLRFSGILSAYTSGTFDIVYGSVTMQSGLSASWSFNYPAYELADDVFRIHAIAGAPNLVMTVESVSVTETASGWTYSAIDGFCHETGWVNAFYAGNTLIIGNYYKITIQVSMTEGSLLVEAGGQNLGTITKGGIYDFYFTALTTAGEKFTPTSDFDGCILPDIELCQLRKDYEMRLVYDNGAGATDWHTASSSQDPIIYTEDWVTWNITSLAAVLSGGIPVALPYSCFRVELRDFCYNGVEDSFQYTSDTLINYKAEHDCTKRIRSWADGEALGFNFGDNGNLFKLIQRFRTLYMSPTYPNSGEDYRYSTGTIKRIFAETEKHYEMLFDYMDEFAHDTMGNGMIPCDIFEVDGVEMLVIFKDYEPQWADRGKRNLAQSTIEVQKRIEKILFNRNCS